MAIVRSALQQSPWLGGSDVAFEVWTLLRVVLVLRVSSLDCFVNDVRCHFDAFPSAGGFDGIEEGRRPLAGVSG